LEKGSLSTYQANSGSCLTMTNDEGADAVNAGSPISFFITVGNAGAPGRGAATNTTVSAPLPAATGLNWSVSGYTGPGTCGVTGSVGAQTLGCSLGTLDGGITPVAVDVTTGTTLSSCGSYRVTATASTTSGRSISVVSNPETVLCPVLATIATPAPGSTLGGSTVTFTWNAAGGASAYWLDVGTVQGQGSIFAANLGLATSQSVSGIPTNGATIYVRLWTQINGNWNYNDYTYTAATGTLAAISSPTPGSTFGGSAVTFTWNTVSGADNYWLDVGNSVGSGDISAGSTTATSKTVSGLPCDGRTLYVQLWTHLNGNWQTPARYTYTACSGLAQMTSPAPATTLSGTSVTFTWTTASGADNYWLDVGNSVGQGDISAGATTATSKIVNGLPCDGRTLYVQLWTHFNGNWQTPARYTYTACNAGLAQVNSPAPGSTLTGSTVTFSWTAAAGAAAYWLDVGTALGQGNIYGANVGTALSHTVSGIPVNGVPIYVQLWSQIGGTWYPERYTYTAFH